MQLSQKEADHLARRRKLVRSWPYVGACLLVVIVALAIYLHVKARLLINPFEAVTRLESGTLQPSSLEMMAVLLPVMSIVVWFLLVVLIVLMHAAFSNEKKYQRMLEKMDKIAPALGQDRNLGK
jgi:hypothetical protein